MLVLSRKQGEQIRIGDDIVVTVQRIAGNRVSLGIEAPTDCKIVRGELLKLLDDFDAAVPIVEQHKRPIGENRIAQIIEKTMRSAK